MSRPSAACLPFFIVFGRVSMVSSFLSGLSGVLRSVIHFPRTPHHHCLRAPRRRFLEAPAAPPITSSQGSLTPVNALWFLRVELFLRPGIRPPYVVLRTFKEGNECPPHKPSPSICR